MKKLKEAKKILIALGLPKAQQNDMSAFTFLALCGIGKKSNWGDASPKSLTVSKGIMKFLLDEYKVSYAPNTRETVRRNALHQFLQAGLVEYNPDEPNLPVNSPKAHYRISINVLSLVRKFGSDTWESAIAEYNANNQPLSEKYNKIRQLKKIPVEIDGKKLQLSPGKHSEVQAQVINEFCPRFSPEAQVLYLGDTENKSLIVNHSRLLELKIRVDKHSKLPDVILFMPSKDWLFLIEVATSHGPLSPKRFIELEELFSQSGLGRIYVTAFPDRAIFRKFSADIAWETEVWIASDPDHLIHFNGDRFFGPRS